MCVLQTPSVQRKPFLLGFQPWKHFDVPQEKTSVIGELRWKGAILRPSRYTQSQVPCFTLSHCGDWRSCCPSQGGKLESMWHVAYCCRSKMAGVLPHISSMSSKEGWTFSGPVVEANIQVPGINSPSAAESVSLDISVLFRARNPAASRGTNEPRVHKSWPLIVVRGPENNSGKPRGEGSGTRI